MPIYAVSVSLNGSTHGLVTGVDVEDEEAAQVVLDDR